MSAVELKKLLFEKIRNTENRELLEEEEQGMYRLNEKTRLEIENEEHRGDKNK